MSLSDIIFGTFGNDETYIGNGWDAASPGFRRPSASRCDVWLEHPAPAPAFRLTVSLQLFDAFEVENGAPLTVAVRGCTLSSHAEPRFGKLSIVIPGDLLASPGPIRVTLTGDNLALRRVTLVALDHSAIPRITGDGGMSIEALAEQGGAPAEKLLLGFESLGDNCEFGFVQRACGAEPLSLLRFAGMPYQQLLRALTSRFLDFGILKNLSHSVRTETNGKQFHDVRDDAYEFGYHTNIVANELPVADLLERQSHYIKFLARKLAEDLTDGSKIFIYRNKQQRAAKRHSANP